MAIDKISFKAENTVQNIKKEEPKKSETPKVDEEKSMSMEKMIGLGAAAAIAIGGIIYAVRRGNASKAVTTATNSTTPTRATDEVADNANDIIEIVKKRADGTIKRIIKKDKDGNLQGVTRYADDGKTVNMSKTYKNGVLVEAKYLDKDGKIILEKVPTNTHAGFKINKYKDGKIVNQKEYWRNLFSETTFNSKTGKKSMYVEFFDDGSIKNQEFYDKKTGTIVRKSIEVDRDNITKVTEYGQGKSKKITEIYPDGEVYIRIKSVKEIIKDKDGKIISEKHYNKKGRTTEIDYVNGAKHIKKTYNKNGEKYTQELFLNVENPKYKTGLTKNSEGKEVGWTSYCVDGKPNSCTFVDKNGIQSTLSYKDGKKFEKLISNPNDGSFIRKNYSPNGNIIREETSFPGGRRSIVEYFENGENKTWTIVNKSGDITKQTKYYPDNKTVKSFSIEHFENGSTEFEFNYVPNYQDKEGFHPVIEAMKFDKNGNIVPHSGSTRGDLGDINEIRTLLDSIGERGILKEYYRPNGQTSLF